MGKAQLDVFLCIFRMFPGLNFAVIENCADKTWNAQYSLVFTPVKWSHLSVAFECQNELEKEVKVMLSKLALYTFLHTDCGRTMSPNILYWAFHISESTDFKLRTLFVANLHHVPQN